jgi:hypothetical protein
MMVEEKDITVAVKRKVIKPMRPVYREYRVGYSKLAQYKPETFLKYFSDYETIPELDVIRKMVRKDDTQD